MTRLSECMAKSEYVIARSWATDVAALEAELDAERLRAMELTARCDRERALRVAAEEARRDAQDSASRTSFAHERDALATCTLLAEVQAEIARGVHGIRRVSDADADKARAIAILTLVYEMREHALRLDVERERAARKIGMGVAQGELNRRDEKTAKLSRRAQAAESRAIKAERQLATQVATLTARLDGAIREMDAKRVEEWARVCREWNPVATMPESALEATSGGARGLDAAETCGECGGTGFEPAFVDGEFTDDLVPCHECAERRMDAYTDDDLARRRVTERAVSVTHSAVPRIVHAGENGSFNAARVVLAGNATDADWVRAAQDECARLTGVVAERDARIATLERERDAAFDQADTYARESDARDAKTRAEMIARYEGLLEAVKLDRRDMRLERDEAIARAERAEDDARGLRDMYGCELLCGSNALGKPYEVRGNSGAISYVQEMFQRAERAEADLEAVRRERDGTDRAWAASVYRALRAEAVIAKASTLAHWVVGSGCSGRSASDARELLAILEEGKEG